MIRDSKQLQIGKAGEYLVCADLIIYGFVAFPSEQGLPYDVVLDNGNKLIRIQVKTTEKPRIIPQRKTKIPAYIFSIKRAGRNGKTIYSENEIDLFALVCLNTKNVVYVKNKDMPCTINLRVDSERCNYYDEKGIQDYNKCIELQGSGIKNKSEISRIVGISPATGLRYLKNGYIPFISDAKYFSDFKRDKEWFLTL